MSQNLETTYNPKAIEDKLYSKWCEKKYFHAEVDRSKKPFTIVMPPPNITGKLHMGHALDNTMQDILIRYKRMQGYNALWVPGTDHAAISTEVKVTNQLKEEGYEFDAVVLNDSTIPTPLKLSPKNRLERLIYLSDDRNITAKYVAGRKIL